MELRLVIASGKLAGKEIRAKGHRFVIGRSEGCQLRLQHSEVSRRHCAILVENGIAAIEDFGSTNGTFVNDQRISGRHVLRDGDRIRVGALKLEVRLVADAKSEKKPQARAVQEPAVRAVSSTPAGGDDIDISAWIGDESTLQLTVPPPTTPGDTLTGKSLVDTTMMSTARLEKEKEKEKAEKNKTPAKGGKARHLPPKPSTADSGTAADDALRQLFHRRKS